MSPLTRFLELVQVGGLWDGVPVLSRPLIVAAARRDPERTAVLLDQLADMWWRAKEETHV